MENTLTSIIILTHNNLPITKQCVSSILQYTKENIEFIFVDNGSSDDTVDYLKTISNATVITNNENKGFAKGCNQGLSFSNGENVVLLNNDTVVTKNWLTRLLWWLDSDESIGIVGPRSNFVIPDQIISSISYKNMDEMQAFATNWSNKNERKGNETEYLSGFCMAFKKKLTSIIGGFDEQFYPGYYEDTDFGIRTRISGKKLWVANDVFIHHHGSQSFKSKRRLHRKIVNENHRKFLRKWKIHNINDLTNLVNREKPFNKERHYIPII